MSRRNDSICISWSFGYTIGPFLAGVFSDFFIKAAFILALVVYLMGLIVIIFFIPNINNLTKNNEELTNNENKSLPSLKDTEEIEQIQYNPLESAEINPNKFLLVRIILGMLIYAMLGKIALTYFSDYASRPEGLNFSGTLIGLILFLFGVGRTTYFVLSRVIKSSLKRITFSYLIISILLISMLLIQSIWIVIIVFIIFGLCSGLIYKSSLELLLYYEKKAKGARAGLFESAIGLGSAMSPLIAGLLAEVFLTFPFLVFSILALLIFLFNLIFENRIKKLQS